MGGNIGNTRIIGEEQETLNSVEYGIQRKVLDKQTGELFSIKRENNHITLINEKTKEELFKKIPIIYDRGNEFDIVYIDGMRLLHIVYAVNGKTGADSYFQENGEKYIPKNVFNKIISQVSGISSGIISGITKKRKTQDVPYKVEPSNTEV